jgi:hypothetical protein
VITSEIDKSFLRPLRPSSVVHYRQESTEYWRAAANADASSAAKLGTDVASDYLYEFPGDLTNSRGS